MADHGSDCRRGLPPMFAVQLRFRFLAVLMAFLAAASGPVAGGDWPQWRGPRRDGICRESGWAARWPADGPRELWRAELGRGLSAVAVSRGRLYTMGSRRTAEVVTCLEAATGEEVWRQAYPARRQFAYPGPAATPTVDGERVYTLGREGHLVAFDAATGEVAWARELRKDFHVDLPKPDYGHSCSPLVVGDRLIVEVGARDGVVVAFEKATGEVAWRSGRAGVLAYSSPLLFEQGGERRVAVFHALGLGVLDPASGEELWRFPWKTHDRCSVATPIVAEDKVFISSSYGRGAALLRVGADEPLWRTREMMCHHATCVLWEGYLYGFHYDRKQAATLRCLSFETGEVQWSQAGLGNGTLLLADGKLIVLGQRGELVVADASPRGFRPVSRAKVLGGLCWTVPVLAHGRLYCRNHPGRLLCLDLRAPPAKAVGE
ncbi:MAG: PQQ-binding-like beta-propeller repeat protein [Candidatus Brocadiia bacterium]